MLADSAAFCVLSDFLSPSVDVVVVLWFQVGNAEGDIYTLTVPELRGVSKVNAFKYSVDLLHCSPDKKWIFASGTHQNILPVVGVALRLNFGRRGSTLGRWGSGSVGEPAELREDRTGCSLISKAISHVKSIFVAKK